MLAAVFDLVSDDLKYDLGARTLLKKLSNELLDSSVAELLFDLMSRKQKGGFGLNGLERGVGAFRAVIKHLKSDAHWRDENEILSCGVLLQVVDDLLDIQHDAARGELNFMQCENSHIYISQLMQWDYRKSFSGSKHPLALFVAIGYAKFIGGKSKHTRAQSVLVVGR